MEDPHEHQLHTLFAALTAGDLATFLEWCTDDMSLTVRGTEREGHHRPQAGDRQLA